MRNGDTASGRTCCWQVASKFCVFLFAACQRQTSIKLDLKTDSSLRPVDVYYTWLYTGKLHYQFVEFRIIAVDLFQLYVIAVFQSYRWHALVCLRNIFTSIPAKSYLWCILMQLFWHKNNSFRQQNTSDKRNILPSDQFARTFPERFVKYASEICDMWQEQT